MRYKVISVSLVILTVAYAVGTGRYEFLFASGFGLVAVIGSFRKQEKFTSVTTRVGRSAELPSGMLEQDILRNMEVGDVAYTLPWGMMIDKDMRCHLNGTYPAEPFPSGTVSMRVERREDGYHVFATETGEQFHPRSGGIPWLGSTEQDLIPVVAVH